MEEYIGKVKLILDYYKGEDTYSDGEVEDEILDIVKNCDEQDYGSIIKERKKWPILYHLSNLRGNIIKSMSVNSTDEILEIGAGCGAVTAALCHMGKKLDCVDLSKKRSSINAYRNKDAENLSIFVGNFQDIEPKLPKYDVITLIGVLEYAASYIKAEKPYEEFLRIAKKHLKQGGRIYIAIENRFGMKYWAGCQEDHLGGLFKGIDGYRPEDGVRTFGRKELEGVIRAAGFETVNFYYPYPDYKFPMSVYSDDYFPKKGWLVNNNMNFDRNKVYLFEESRVYDQIIDEGNYPFFANSFLAEASDSLDKKDEASAKLIYSKFSGERNPEYAIKTDIYQEKNGKFIIKSPLNREGEEHVRRIAGNYDRLSKMFAGSKIKVQPVICFEKNAIFADVKPENCAACRFPFIEGEIFENRLNSLIEKNETEAAYAEIRTYFELLKEKAGNRKFICESNPQSAAETVASISKSQSAVENVASISGSQSATETVASISKSQSAAETVASVSGSQPTAETVASVSKSQPVSETIASVSKPQPDIEKKADFVSVFGNESFPEDTVCGEISNIDYCFGNIIIAEDGWYLIDYEWCFDFPIPLDFLLFRAIHYFVHGSTWGSRLIADNVFGRFGFDDEKKEKYERMEARFHRYISGKKTGIGELKQTMLAKTWNIHEMYREFDKADVHKPLQIYYDYGEGFFHENSYLKMPEIENGVISIEVSDIPENAQRVRIDVRKRPCMLFIKSFTDGDGNDMIPDSVVNGYRIGEKSYACPADDPWIVVKHGKEKSLVLSFAVEGDFLGQYGENETAEWKPRKELENRISQIEKHEQELKNKIAELESKTAGLEDEILKEKNKAALYREHCEERTRKLSEELEEKRELVSIMENSTSWKMTKPMRDAMRKIKNIKG